MCWATMEGLERVRGSSRGTDCFEGSGGHSTLIRSTAGFVGELPRMCVGSLIASEFGLAVPACSVAHFFELVGLEGWGDTSQFLKSGEGRVLFP